VQNLARIAPARGGDAHCPSTARQTTFNDHTHTHTHTHKYIPLIQNL
jgi:hypothetical protein